MRYAIVSDIHGNMEALTAVLADIDTFKVDTIVCLGDVVGYGPEPEQVIQTIRQRRILTILGNHDNAVLDAAFLDWFNPVARRMIVRTKAMLSAESIAFLRSLVLFAVYHNARFVHGFPPDSFATYLFQIEQQRLTQTLSRMTQAICFVGHTHLMELVAYNGRSTKRRPLGRETVPLVPGHRYLINIGSVGQPRDGDNHAKYGLWDTAAGTLEVRFVPYDIDAVAQKILAAGLPPSYANRLR